MIAATTTRAIVPSSGPDLRPVEFKVLSPMFFRGQRVEPGATLQADVDEAAALHGNHHTEMLNAAEALPRVRAASHLTAAELLRANNPNRTGWFKRS